MYDPAGVTTSPELPVPEQMQAWVLGDPDQLSLRDKPTPVPGRAEVLVRIDAVDENLWTMFYDKLVAYRAAK